MNFATKILYHLLVVVALGMEARALHTGGRALPLSRIPSPIPKVLKWMEGTGQSQGSWGQLWSLAC